MFHLETHYFFYGTENQCFAFCEEKLRIPQTLSPITVFLQLHFYEASYAHAVTLILDMFFLLIEVCKSAHNLPLLLYSELS